MQGNWRSRCSFSIIATLAIALMAGPFSTARADHDAPVVIPPQVKAYGRTYGEWSAKWWQHISKIPWSQNPLNDSTGEFCARGQKGKVWFLTDVLLLDRDVTLTRNCTLPSSKAIFFPILSFESDGQLCYPADLTIDQLRQFARDQIDRANHMSVIVDGVALPIYRVESTVFSYTLPDDNWLNGIEALAPGSCPLHANAGKYGPAVSDGYWIMLAPLPAGKHTLHIKGIFNAPAAPLAEDITYQLTIVNGRGDDGIDD